MMLAGLLAIVAYQRVSQKKWRLLLQLLVLAIAVLTGISRIYVGVHYPTDVLGGWLLSATMLSLLYPYYDEWRFKWRFQGKQR